MSANYSGAGFSDMHFNVDGVPAERFAQWVTATRIAGPVLDAQTYADLAKPSQAVAPFSYRAVAPDLFKGIVSSPSTPKNASRFVSPTSQRAEK
jgi:cytochrome o ubiquinol oxidase subunit 2